MIIRTITKGINSFKIYFENGKLLILEFKNNDYHQGYSSWYCFWGINDLDTEAGEILGDTIINYHELPPIIKSHIEWILSDLNSG